MLVAVLSGFSQLRCVRGEPEDDADAALAELAAARLRVIEWKQESGIMDIRPDGEHERAMAEAGDLVPRIAKQARELQKMKTAESAKETMGTILAKKVDEKIEAKNVMQQSFPLVQSVLTETAAQLQGVGLNNANLELQKINDALSKAKGSARYPWGNRLLTMAEDRVMITGDREAANCFIASINTSANAVGAYYGMGFAFARMGMNPQALWAYQEYVKRDRNSTWAAAAHQEIARLRQLVR